MKSKRKFILPILIVFFCSLFLIGCEKNNSKNDKEKDNSLTSETVTADIKEDGKDKKEGKNEEDKKEDKEKATDDVIDLDKKLEEKIEENKEKIEEKKIDETKSSLDNFPQPKTFNENFNIEIDKSELKSSLTLETSYKMLMNLPSVSNALKSNTDYSLYVTEGKTTYDAYIAIEEGNIEKDGKLIPIDEHLYQIDKLSRDIYHFDLNSNEFKKISKKSKD